MKKLYKLFAIALAIGFLNQAQAQEAQNEFPYMKFQDEKVNVDLDLFMGVRNFHIATDIARWQGHNHMIKNGGGLALQIGKGNWQLGAGVAGYYGAFQETFTTNMFATGLAANRKLQLYELTNLPIAINIGAGVEYKRTIFEGTYFKEFPDAAIGQIDFENNGYEPRLGHVNQVTPFVRLGAEWELQNFDKPVKIFMNVERHFGGINQTNYEAFRNTQVVNDTQFNFGFRMRLF